MAFGAMADGEWRIGGLPEDGRGRFARPPTSFRRRVTADGSSGFPAEAGHYHLYVSRACPWAHRTAIPRKLKGFEDAASRNHTRDLYQQPGVAGTVRIRDIKEHYITSHENVNPTRIVPEGPVVDFGKAPRPRPLRRPPTPGASRVTGGGTTAGQSGGLAAACPCRAPPGPSGISPLHGR